MLRFVAATIAICLVQNATAAEETSPTTEDYVPIAKIEISNRLSVSKLSQANLLEKLKGCTSSYNASTASQVVETFGDLAKGKYHVHFGNASGEAPAVFVVNGAIGTCVMFSENRYPIWAAEVFYKSVSPTGVPKQVTDSWYSLLAKDIALTGQAKAAYIFNTGRAVMVTYSILRGAYLAHSFTYKSEFKNIDSWVVEEGVHRFEHPELSSVISNGGGKHILDGIGL